MNSTKICNLLKELRAFCITYQEGSMSHAAKILCASQPTVSLQIKKLESELNAELFERCGPKLKTTTEGEILYKIAIPLIQEFDNIKDTFSAQQSDLVTGQLAFAAEESTLLYTLSKPIQKFITQYPGIRLNISNVTGRESCDMVISDKIDFAVCSLLETPETLDYSPFASYSPVLITLPDHPLTKLNKITMNEIGKYGLILPSQNFSSWRLIKMIFQLNGVNCRVVLEIGGWEIVKHFVEIGLGISIVTNICLTKSDTERFAIRSLAQYFPSRTYGVVKRRGKILSTPARRFINSIHEHFNSKKSNRFRPLRE